MVTEAGKELLRATIHTAKFHNRILEENEMWKQWELECGLTMMVSDDDILKKIRKNHMCSKHRRRDREKNKREHYKSDQIISPSAGTSKEPSDRWDHSGFLELYPDGAQPSSSSKADSAKWDHSGFHELYPDKAKHDKYSSSSSSKSHSNKHKKKKRKHHRHSSTSDNEIYEEFKRYKRSKTDKHKSDNAESALGFDNHIKEWKKIKHK